MTALLLAAALSSLILLVALGTSWLLRRRGAGLRHAVIATGLGCAAIVPLLSAVVPPWIPQGIALPAIRAVMPAPALPDAGVRIPQPLPGQGEAPRESVEGLAATVAGMQPYASARVDRAGLAGKAYGAGLIIALALLLLELMRVGWLAARARPMRAAAWLGHMEAVARAYGLQRSVQLKLSAHPSLLATWGFLRPQVLLPAGAGQWPDERIRAVLLHELAHIRRNDWLLQLLAALVRAVYWFNPLVWIACRRLRLESELACDDAVLARGMSETDYADALLALARSMSRTARWLGPAPAMARRSTLQRRVAHVLDEATVRTDTTRASLAWMMLLMLLATCVVAACGAARSPEQEPAPAAMGTSARTSAVAETPTPEAPAPGAEESLPQSPAPALPASAEADARPTGVAVPATPQQVVAGILDLVRAARANELTGMLDDITRPITGLRHIERHALAVVNDDGREPAILAANCVQIVNALVNTGNLAKNIRRQPGAAQLPPAAFEQLGAALHAKAAELADVLMPVLTTDPAVASTQENLAAVTARDLARSRLKDVAFVGPRPGSWLVTELDTLERAASAVLNDQNRDGRATALKLHVLQGSLQSTIRQANQLAGRADRPAANRGKAEALVQSLQGVSARLDEVISHPPDISSRDYLATVLARVAEEVPALQLVTLRRSENAFMALLGSSGEVPINVMIEEAGSEAEAIRNEERSVMLTPVMGEVTARNGIRLNTWGGEQDASGYRVQARVGTRVVNVSAPPDLGHFVLPILDSIVVQIH